MIKDTQNHESRYAAWKDEVMRIGVTGLSKTNSDLLKQYVFDMEDGKNIARGTRKGKRSTHRLNTLRSRVKTILMNFEKHKVKVMKCTEKQAHDIFNNTKRADGKNYESNADLVKDFKSFWHWLMLVNRKLYHQTNGKKGALLEDVTLDLDTSKPENDFVHFSKDELEQMLPYFSPDEQTILLFAFDTIIRTGKELANVMVSDLTETEQLTIREETAKTYGRTVKLLICKDALKDYLKRHKLKDDDYLFNYSAPYLNRKLKKVAVQVFGDKMTKGGKKFSEISLYDCRHSGACHWRLTAYQSKIDALMYRGGWSNLSMLNYYTKKIGMRDSIEKEDLLIGVDKTEIEKRIANIEMVLRSAALGHNNIKEKDKQEVEMAIKNLMSAT